MGLIRIIVPAIAIWLAWWWFRRWQASRRRDTTGTGAEKMRQCRHCGVYVPASAAVHAGGQWYCSDAHRLESEQP